jgi:hypothetical protein
MQPELDVYQPPKAEIGTSTERPRLYSAQQVAVATFIGGPIAGCLLLGSNYGALGKPSQRLQVIVMGAVATAGVLALALVLPKNFPNSIVPVAYTIALRSFAKTVEGPTPPTVRQSWWKAVGIGFASLIMLLVLFVGYFVLIGDDS